VVHNLAAGEDEEEVNELVGEGEGKEETAT
jgi:hypothetical protein